MILSVVRSCFEPGVLGSTASVLNFGRTAMVLARTASRARTLAREAVLIFSINSSL